MFLSVNYFLWKFIIIPEEHKLIISSPPPGNLGGREFSCKDAGNKRPEGPAILIP
jgi:hypothetical protein